MTAAQGNRSARRRLDPPAFAAATGEPEDIVAQPAAEPRHQRAHELRAAGVPFPPAPRLPYPRRRR